MTVLEARKSTIKGLASGKGFPTASSHGRRDGKTACLHVRACMREGESTWEGNWTHPFLRVVPSQ